MIPENSLYMTVMNACQIEKPGIKELSSKLHKKLQQAYASINEINIHLSSKLELKIAIVDFNNNVKASFEKTRSAFSPLLNSSIFSKIYSIIKTFFKTLFKKDPMIELCKKASQHLDVVSVRLKIPTNNGEIKQLIVTPDNKVYIQQEFIARGTSKKIFRLEEYDFAGNKQKNDYAQYICAGTVHIQEVHNESAIAEDIGSEYVNRISKLVQYKTKSENEKVIFISPLYKGTLANMKEAPFKDKIDIAIDVTRGVLAMHQAGYIHCDLHLGNLFVNGNRGVVGDLGAAKRTSEQMGIQNIPVTSENNIYGLILSPECSFGQAQSKASDIYALGLTFRGFFRDADHPLAKELRSFAEYHSDTNWAPRGGMQANNSECRPTIENVLNKLLEIKQRLAS
jgi:serine/threonine protein kinase